MGAGNVPHNRQKLHSSRFVPTASRPAKLVNFPPGLTPFASWPFSARLNRPRKKDEFG
jgi:hypothetical protein